jgi:hypothetical protein
MSIRAVGHKFAKHAVHLNYTPLALSALCIVSVRVRRVKQRVGLESDTGEMGRGQAAGSIYTEVKVYHSMEQSLC